MVIQIKKNEYQIYKESGRPTRFNLNGFSEVGNVYEVKNDSLYLLPVLVNEHVPLAGGETKYNSRIETKIPTRVDFRDIQTVNSLSEGFLERFAKATNALNKDIEGEQLNLFSKD